MEGFVSAALDAIIPLEIQDMTGRRINVDAILDTGFTGELGLPAEVIEMLSFQRRGLSQAILGDGQEVTVGTYHAHVMWHGSLRKVRLLALDTPLVGMKMLWDSDVHMRVVKDGRVTVEPIENAIA